MIVKRFLTYAKPVIDRFPALAMAYRNIRDNCLRLQEPAETPLGFKLAGNPAMENATFEPDEIEISKKILEKVDVFVNVGANIGFYCCLALHMGKHVVAFEPIRHNLRYLYKNMKANHWDDRVEIFPIALSNRSGIIDIFGGGTNASLVKGWIGQPEHQCESVPTFTLDKVLGNRLYGATSYILVDIEGAEKIMLEGATVLLSQDPKPIWLIEIFISEHQAENITINPQLLQTFRIFWDKGYESWTSGKEIRLVHPHEIESIVKSGVNCLQTHNFIFIESGRMAEILNLRS